MSRIPHRSKKTAAKYVERRALVERLLRERPACEACATYRNYTRPGLFMVWASEDIHELISRGRGGDILDENNLLAVCRPCHTWITDNPSEAEFCGLALPSWATDEIKQEAADRRLRFANGESLEKPSWF